MECPVCAGPVEQSETPEGGLSFWCSSCGWGTGKSAATAEPAPQRTSLSQLGLLWLVSLVVVIAPYFGLRYGALYLGDVGVDPIDDGVAWFVELLNVHYWWVMALYVFLSATLTPSYDPDNLGLFGGFVDNPFSLSDDFNRFMLLLAIVLFPGKIVWVTLTQTVRAVISRGQPA